MSIPEARLPAGSTDPSHDAVREQLERMLASRAFLKADALSRLLRFVVDHELAGRRERLREQVIAEDVFGRRDFNPQTDTIVRTQARRLRDRLAAYYRAEGQAQPVRILLEKGSYVPIFQIVTSACRDEIPDSSIVVLPFLNLTGDSGEDYFSDGLTEEIINALTRVRGLKVVARTSSFAFRGRDVDIREIGQRLKVASALEGSVRRSGGRIRVTAQLIATRTGFHRWSENYDTQVDDVLRVQDEVAGAIAASLVEKSVPPRRRALGNMEAYSTFLRGIQAFYRISTDGIQDAIELFGRAMALDPHFAPAPAYLGMMLATIGWLGIAPASDVLPRARALAQQANALDPESPEARLALALIRFCFDHDLDGAIGDFNDLLEVAPGYAFARLPKAYALLAQRRFDEAAAAAEEAAELDPLSAVNVYNQAVVAYFARRWDAVERFGNATVALAPEFGEGYLALAVTGMETQQFEQAVSHIEKAVSMNATFGRELLVVCRCRMGQWDLAETELDRLVALQQHTYVAPHRLALAASAFPDRTRALDYLDRAWEARDPRLIWLATWPFFDPLHAEPRFQALCERVGVARFLPRPL